MDMSIGKTIESLKSYFNDHMELVRKNNVKVIIVSTVPMSLVVGSMILAIFAPMVGISLCLFWVFFHGSSNACK